MSLQPDQPLFAGMDLGATNVQGGLVRSDGRVMVRDKVKTKAEQGEDAVLQRMTKLLHKLLEQAELRTSDLAGLGVGAPGAIDVREGMVLDAPNLRWRDMPLARRLQEETGLATVIDNDANAGVWGECVAGAGAGEGDLLGVFVGTGVGGGLVLGGELYHGPRHTAGELGHTVLHVDMPVGLRTLEDLASRSAIANRLRQLVAANQASVLVELTEGDMKKIKSKTLAEAWRREDPLVRQVLTDAAEHVGAAVASAVSLLSLPRVIVGGGLTEAMGEPWTELVREAFRRHVFPAKLGDTQVLTSTLGDDAGVIGAGLLARARGSTKMVD